MQVRQKRGKPTQNQRGSLGYAYSQSDIDHVCALSDPFCPEARGAKIPDSDSSKSFAVQLRDVAGLVPDANGRAAMYIGPGLNSKIRSHATMNATQVSTWTGASSIADYTALSTAGEAYRIVSWGVRIYSQLAPTDQSGQFRVITTPEEPITPFLYNTSFFEEIKVYPTTEDSVHWTSKPIGTAHKEYIPMADAASWDWVVIIADGLPVTTASAFTVEIVFNLEVQPNFGSITGALSTPASPHKPHVLSAAGEVLSKHGGAMIRRGASNFFANAARAALNFVSTKLIGFPVASQPRILN